LIALEERDPAAGTEHAVKLVQGALFVLDVDEHRARRDDVHTSTVDRGEVLRGSLDQSAAIEHAGCGRQLAAVLEERLRDVREDHLSGPTLERPERDQSVAAPDIEQRLTGVDLSIVEHPVTDGPELLEHRRLVFDVTAGAAVADPVRPAVAHAWSAERISSCSGNRPLSRFEKTSSPSRRTSNWPFPPGMSRAGIPFSCNSAARLAARSS
jgi:hypothetical protein